MAVELSVWTGEGGCFHPIASSGFRSGIISFAAKKNAPVSASAAEDITYFEHNLLGNFLIREKFSKISFPLMLLEVEDREKLLGLFHDMAPKRTNLYRKIWETIDAIVVALVLAVHIIQYAFKWMITNHHIATIVYVFEGNVLFA